jgi:hypothetical protein
MTKSKITAMVLCIFSPLLGDWLGSAFAFINYKLGGIVVPTEPTYIIFATIGIIVSSCILAIKQGKP